MIHFPSIDPTICSVSILGFEFALRWYALSYIVGFIFALQIMKYYIRRRFLWLEHNPPFDNEQADALLTFLIIGVIVGGRLGYVLFYNFNFYAQNLGDILRVWDGGMAFHGGFLGVILAGFCFFRFHQISTLSASDLVALATPPGLFLGRVANFVNAELWGRPTTLPWGVIFPSERAQNCPNIVDGFCARHPTQLYEAFLEGLILFVILVYMVRLGALKKPGLILGFFVFFYGLSRYFVEFFRVPDAQFFSSLNPYGFAFRIGEFGLTMGQALSLPMIVFGMILVTIKLIRS